MRTQHLFALALPCLFVAAWTPAFAAPTAAEAQKPIKTLINGVRYGKYDLALKQLAFAEMVKRLLADNATKFSADEQKELAAGIATIIRADSFPKGKDKFQYLDSVLYEDPRDQGADVVCKSTIVIFNKLKKTELVIDWVLMKAGDAYAIVDMVLLGESTVLGIREDQVLPLFTEGGAAKVMEFLRKKVAEVSKKK
jgi:hypothetical protein